jgi:hypothetical protein
MQIIETGGDVAAGIAEGEMRAQGKRRGTDVPRALMSEEVQGSVVAVMASPERRRTVLAVVSASIISLVVWGLIVVLNVH